MNRPAKPEDDKLAGLMWVWNSDEGWIEVCDYCHGNCGQCGITGRVGNRPYSFEAIIKNGGWDKGGHAGLPSPGNSVRMSQMIERVPHDLKHFSAQTMGRRLARQIDTIVLVCVIVLVALAWWYDL